jgi:hypothetical protein
MNLLTVAVIGFFLSQAYIAWADQQSENSADKAEHHELISTSLPTIVLTAIVVHPSETYKNLEEWVSGKSDGEKKGDRSQSTVMRRLSLFHSVVDDSIQYLKTGETTPLLLANFQHIAPLMDEDSETKLRVFAERLVQAGEMFTWYEMKNAAGLYWRAPKNKK